MVKRYDLSLLDEIRKLSFAKESMPAWDSIVANQYDVVNGIAYDAVEGVFYVTGRRWHVIFKL